MPISLHTDFNYFFLLEVLTLERISAETWLFRDLIEEYGNSYGLVLSQESDYNVALLQSSSHHQVGCLALYDGNPASPQPEKF